MLERAAGVAAMLDRWDAENVFGEREWSVEDLEPMSLRRAFGDDESATRG